MLIAGGSVACVFSIKYTTERNQEAKNKKMGKI